MTICQGRVRFGFLCFRIFFVCGCGPLVIAWAAFLILGGSSIGSFFESWDVILYFANVISYSGSPPFERVDPLNETLYYSYLVFLQVVFVESPGNVATQLAAGSGFLFSSSTQR